MFNPEFNNFMDVAQRLGFQMDFIDFIDFIVADRREGGK